MQKYLELLLSAKNDLPVRTSFILHSYKRLCRKGACLSGIYAKRHTDLVLTPTYTVRRTHVHRTSYACTPNDVRAYTERRTCPSEREAATKHAEREGVRHFMKVRQQLLPGGLVSFTFDFLQTPAIWDRQKISLYVNRRGKKFFGL